KRGQSTIIDTFPVSAFYYYLTLALSGSRFRPNCWLTFAALFIRSRSAIHPCDTVVLRGWIPQSLLCARRCPAISPVPLPLVCVSLVRFARASPLHPARDLVPSDSSDNCDYVLPPCDWHDSSILL